MCRTMLAGVLALSVIWGAASAAGEDPERLLTEGRHKEALAAVEARLTGLPVDRRLSVWEIDFMGSEVDHAYVGSAHLYFTYHVPNSNPKAPGMTSTLQKVEPSGRSDWQHVVVCVDARTGGILWSRPYAGLSRLTVDPADDTLYLIGTEAVVWLTADGGDPMMRPLVNKEHVVGLLTKSGYVVSAPHGLRTDWNRDSVYLYATSTRTLTEVKLPDLVTLSPDEAKRLKLSANLGGFNNAWSCVTMDGKHLWGFSVAGQGSSCLPRFYKDDVIWMSNTRGQKGQVFRLDGETGKAVWTTVLPDGAYKPSNCQLKGGGCAWDDWDALIPQEDGRLLAIDGTGRLFFLDGESGKVLRTVRWRKTHLCRPTVVGGAMVLCSFEGARAIPLPTLMHSAAGREDERRLLILKARCLAGLGRLDEALAATDTVLDRDGDCADAWKARADVARLRGDALERSFALCRYAQLAETDRLPELCEEFGLVKLIFLGSGPTWHMVEVPGRELYAGTQRGDLWAVWPDTLDARVVETREKEISYLSGEVRLLFTARTGGTQADTNPRRGDPAEPTEAYATWFARGARDGRSVFYRGRHFVPLDGGGVRIWDGKQLVERRPAVQGLKEWRFGFTPAGPLGYGAGGVYQLDDDLCPVRLMLKPHVPPANAKDAREEDIRVDFLRAVGDSLGLVVQTSAGAFLQVYGRDDLALRHEVPLGRWLSSWCRPSQFVVLGDGYLLSDRQLTWASGRNDGGVWRFGPPVSRTETGRWGERWQYFGDPVVRDGRLLVTARDGMIYAFDVAHILRR